MNPEFDRYIALYSADLTRLCLSLCGNIHDADDLFQETWLKAMKGYHRYNTEKPFDKWLFSICANTYKDSLRLSFNRRRFEFSSDEEKEGFLSSIPDESGKTEEYLELYDAMEKLPKKQRVTLSLFYFKDFSVKEIAEILSVPENTVSSRLKAAKKNLRRWLNDD